MLSTTTWKLSWRVEAILPSHNRMRACKHEYDDSLRRGERDGCHFAIESGGKLIGVCDLFHFDETAHTCELGILIGDKSYWGQGLGREAISLLLQYAFQYRNQHKVWLRVNENNKRALSAYRACGLWKRVVNEPTFGVMGAMST